MPGKSPVGAEEIHIIPLSYLDVVGHASYLVISHARRLLFGGHIFAAVAVLESDDGTGFTPVCPVTYSATRTDGVF